MSPPHSPGVGTANELEIHFVPRFAAERPERPDSRIKQSPSGHSVGNFSGVTITSADRSKDHQMLDGMLTNYKARFDSDREDLISAAAAEESLIKEVHGADIVRTHNNISPEEDAIIDLFSPDIPTCIRHTDELPVLNSTAHHKSIEIKSGKNTTKYTIDRSQFNSNITVSSEPIQPTLGPNDPKTANLRAKFQAFMNRSEARNHSHMSSPPTTLSHLHQIQEDQRAGNDAEMGLAASVSMGQIPRGGGFVHTLSSSNVNSKKVLGVHGKVTQLRSDDSFISHISAASGGAGAQFTCGSLTEQDFDVLSPDVRETLRSIKIDFIFKPIYQFDLAR